MIVLKRTGPDKRIIPFPEQTNMQFKERNVLNSSLIHLLHRAGQAADEHFVDELAGGDLTPRQYAVLSVLATHESASQTEIVGMTGIDRSTLADIVKRLVQRGLLARRRSKQDARAYAVRLTPQGFTLLKSAEPAADRASERMLRLVSPNRREELLKALNLLVEHTRQQQK